VDDEGRTNQSVTLLQFRKVVPASPWLRASILWADDLAAIWPMGRQPTPFNAAQEQSLDEITLLEDANLFHPRHIAYFPHRAFIANVLEQALASDASAPLDRAWQDGGSAVGSITPLADLLSLEYDPETFVYPGKLPIWVTEQLISRNILRPFPDGRGYVIASRDALDRLLAAYATVLYEIFDGRLVPDVEEPAQARRIAAPIGNGETCQGLVLTLRGAVRPDLQTDFRRFIDFRLDTGNERDRKDYIDQLTHLWNLCARGGEDHAFSQTIVQVTTDLRKARESYFKRFDAQKLTIAGLVSFGAVIPLQAGHPPAVIAGALANVAASVLTVTVRNGAPKYIRNATKSELLAPIGGI
jgi:hypothetical protein